MRGEKGITLIALIITIIVMLILVAVSVTAAVQSGLFTAAGNATKETKNAQDAENKLSSGVTNVEGTEYQTPSNYVNNLVNGGV